MKKLESFDFRRGSAGVDWSFLLDGEIYQLTKGEDFQIKPSSAVQSARQWAKGRGTLATSIDGDVITLQLGKTSDVTHEDAKPPADKTKVETEPVVDLTASKTSTPDPEL